MGLPPKPQASLGLPPKPLQAPLPPVSPEMSVSAAVEDDMVPEEFLQEYREQQQRETTAQVPVNANPSEYPLTFRGWLSRGAERQREPLPSQAERFRAAKAIREVNRGTSHHTTDWDPPPDIPKTKPQVPPVAPREPRDSRFANTTSTGVVPPSGPRERDKERPRKSLFGPALHTDLPSVVPPPSSASRDANPTTPTNSTSDLIRC